MGIVNEIGNVREKNMGGAGVVRDLVTHTFSSESETAIGYG